jgi:hypothetical protein
VAHSFRDVTESVRQKAQRRGQNRTSINALHSRAKDDLLQLVGIPQLSINIGKLVDSTDDRALCMFFTDYAWAKKAYMISWDFLPREYSSALAGSCLLSCTQAVALAHYGQKARDESIKNLARKQYGFALTQLNTALSDPAESVSDSTMMAVHLSMIYEVSFGPDYIGNVY